MGEVVGQRLGRLGAADGGPDGDGLAAGSEEGDASSAARDRAAEPLPGAVASDPGGVGALAEDEQDVGWAVVMEAGGCREQAGPLLAGDQLGKRAFELVVEGA